MRQAFVDALNTSDVLAKHRAGDPVVVGRTSAEAARMLAADAQKSGEVARRIPLGQD